MEVSAVRTQNTLLNLNIIHDYDLYEWVIILSVSNFLTAKLLYPRTLLMEILLVIFLTGDSKLLSHCGSLWMDTT
jgi:hypothetical protein